MPSEKRTVLAARSIVAALLPVMQAIFFSAKISGVDTHFGGGASSSESMSFDSGGRS